MSIPNNLPSKTMVMDMVTVMDTGTEKVMITGMDTDTEKVMITGMDNC